MTLCSISSGTDRRRTFWTTQPGACGSEMSCATDCGTPGLQLTESNCGRASCQCCAPATYIPSCPDAPRAPTPRSFVTTDWLRSLVINILMTNAKLPNTKCGYRPGAQGGHWSESFRTDGQKSGSSIRNLPKSMSVRDSMALARATLKSDLAKLVNMGVAQSVEVSTEYLGSNLMSANIEIVGPDGLGSKVGLTGNRNSNVWAWS